MQRHLRPHLLRALRFVVTALLVAIALGAGQAPGEQRPAEALSGIAVDRPDLESIRETTIPLRRSGPCWRPSGDGLFDLDGLPDRDLEVRISGGALFRGEKKTATSARSCVGTAHAQECSNDLTLPLAKGTRARFAVWADGLDSAGEYRTTLVVLSTEAKKPPERQTATVRFTVSDEPWLPLLVVAAGVLSAWTISFLAGKWRTREINYVRLLQMERVLDTWDKKMDPNDANRPALTQLKARVRDQLELNEIYQLAAPDLDKLDTDVRAFHAGPPGVGLMALARRLDVPIRIALGRLNASDAAVTILSMALAVATAFLALYADRTFGTLSDYVNAFLWGFGIDSGVRGVSAIRAKTH